MASKVSRYLSILYILFLEPARVGPPNGVLIGSAVFARLDRVPNNHAHRSRCVTTSHCLVKLLSFVHFCVFLRVLAFG